MKFFNIEMSFKSHKTNLQYFQNENPLVTNNIEIIILYCHDLEYDHDHDHQTHYSQG